MNDVPIVKEQYSYLLTFIACAMDQLTAALEAFETEPSDARGSALCCLALSLAEQGKIADALLWDIVDLVEQTP